MDKRVAKAVLKRDSHMCAFCGSRTVALHHILFRSHNGADKEENLICLCKTHHDLVHSNEKKYRDILMDRQRGIYGILSIDDLKKEDKYKEFKFRR